MTSHTQQGWRRSRGASHTEQGCLSHRAGVAEGAGVPLTQQGWEKEQGHTEEDSHVTVTGSGQCARVQAHRIKTTKSEPQLELWTVNDIFHCLPTAFSGVGAERCPFTYCGRMVM